MPLLYAPTAETVLALATLLSVDHYHLANTTNEMFVERLLSSRIHVAIDYDIGGRRNSAESSRIDLDLDICGHRFATKHDLIDLIVTQS